MRIARPALVGDAIPFARHIAPALLDEAQLGLQAGDRHAQGQRVGGDRHFQCIVFLGDQTGQRLAGKPGGQRLDGAGQVQSACGKEGEVIIFPATALLGQLRAKDSLGQYALEEADAHWDEYLSSHRRFITAAVR